MPGLSEIFTTNKSVRALMRAYAHLHCSVFGDYQGNNLGCSSNKPLKTLWVTKDAWLLVAFVDKDYELFVTFDPLTDKETAMKICEQLQKHFSSRPTQTSLLLT